MITSFFFFGSMECTIINLLTGHDLLCSIVALSIEVRIREEKYKAFVKKFWDFFSVLIDIVCSFKFNCFFVDF